MRTTKALIVSFMLILTAYAASALTLVPELSDDFEYSNLTANGWYIANGQWITTAADGDNALYAPDFTPGSNIIYQRNDSYGFFTADGYLLTYAWKAQNKTAFDGGDSVSISIGENYSNLYTSVCGGYSIGMGVEVDNQCTVAIDYYDSDCTYGGSLYYNTTYFNDTNQACQPNWWNATMAQEGGRLLGYINDDLIYNGSAQAFDTSRFNTVLVFGSNYDASHAQLFMDDIMAYSLEEACVEDWIAQYTNGTCNTSDIRPEHKTYYDNASCGTFDDLPIDNGSISAAYPCNYCLEDISGPFTSYSICIGDQRNATSYFIDNHYASCCLLTSLPTDCSIDLNVSLQNSTALVPCIGVYSTDDVTASVVDIMGTAGTSLKDWTGLLIMVTFTAVLIGSIAIVRYAMRR
jgi:hypothetical protein